MHVTYFKAKESWIVIMFKIIVHKNGRTIFLLSNLDSLHTFLDGSTRSHSIQLLLSVSMLRQTSDDVDASCDACDTMVFTILYSDNYCPYQDFKGI